MRAWSTCTRRARSTTPSPCAFDDDDDGNAALAYSLALQFADRADTLAIGFGAAECDRFGMDK